MSLDRIKGLRKIYDYRSRYQLIQVWEDDKGLGRTLTLDGRIQLTTYDQHRYHECLGVIPYLFTKHARRVAILGGGDGYLAKLLLSVFPIEHLTLVDIDPDVVEAARTFFEFPDDDRLEIVHADAANWVRGDVVDTGTAMGYDLVIADYTDPTSPYSVGLYTIEHFEEIRKHKMAPGAVFATQMVSPYSHPKAAGCLIRTMIEAFPGYGVFPYKVHLPLFPPPSQNGFCLAAPGPIQLQLPQGLRYLNMSTAQSVFGFGNDEIYDLSGVDASTEANLRYAYFFKTAYQQRVDEWEIYESKKNRNAEDPEAVREAAA
jgi:predicted membrane-bound spermidine synthase